MLARPVFVTLALVCASSLVDDGALRRAKDLRDGSGADWDAGRYADAAAKLEEADRLYVAERGDHRAERAIVLRALTWNRVRLGDVDTAKNSFATLLHLGHETPGIDDAAWSASVAIMEAAHAMKAMDEGLSLLDDCRKRALEAGFPKIATQCLHDSGSVASDHGDFQRAIDLIRRCLAEREKQKDTEGCAWSNNNLGYNLMRAGHVDEALAPLRAAFEAVRKGKLLEPQAKVEQNAVLVLEAIERNNEPSEEAVKWVWTIGEMGAQSGVPEVVPSSRFLRAALALERRRGTPSSQLAAADRVRKLKIVAQPAEVRADLTVRAARVAVDAGDGKKALAWLDKLDCGTGPAAPLLRAEASLVRALAQAASGQAKAFVTEATTAAAAFKAVPCRPARAAALRDLVAAADRLKVRDQVSAISDDLAQLEHEGSPGGLGGKASAGGDRRNFEKLGADDPLFEIRFDAAGGKIVVRDLVANQEDSEELTWQPRNVSLNGLGLTVLGGWVVIRSFAYGGAAISEGSAAEGTRDDIGDYWPVPGKGRALVTKRGAVRFEG
ncbi:MAG: hypothetical protein HYR85_12745 [Planctomycetes bacterium]|nr:hypothetical protein [Planctomycetota bacterium]MBI3846319.1 hypothetical protein [Planctomycetota bacterium]